MSNIYDLIPVATKSKTISKSIETKVAEIETKVQVLDQLDNIRKISTKDEYRAFAEPVAKRLVEEFNQLRVDIFGLEMQLPASLENPVEVPNWKEDEKGNRDYGWIGLSKSSSSDNISRLNSSPRAMLSDITKLADTLNMVVIPAEFLNPASYKDESYSMRRSIEAFNKATIAAGLNAYVLCPISFYSVERHVNSDNADLPVYGGGQLGMVLAGITLSLPMFRSMLNQLSVLKADVSNIKTRVVTMQKQVETLQRQVDIMQEQLVLQQLHQRQLEEQQQMMVQATQLKKMELRILDPMMFAIKDFELGKDCTVLIGPCWGPDFDEIIEAVVGNTKVKDQRKKLTQKVAALWS